MHKCIKVKLFIYSGIIKIFKKYPKNQNYLFSYFLLSLSPFSLELTENTRHETLKENLCSHRWHDFLLYQADIW